MLIRGPGDSAWRAPAVTAYEDEAAIQALLAQSPELMPGAAGKRFAVARELTLDAGYVDLVGITSDGDITLIECKLKANPEIRRHVIGQILAYAATLWEMDYADLDAAFTARAGASLSSAVAAVVGETWDEETFRAAVSTNLAAGRFRLVIAVDDITEELRRIVRFLNGHTTHELEVLALELRYVADSGVEILFPTTYGEQVAKPTSPPTQVWDEARFFATINPLLTPSGVAAARRLYDFALARGATAKFGVSTYPSVAMRITVAGKVITLFTLSLWGKNVKPKLYVYFEYLVGNISDAALTELVADLRDVPGFGHALLGLEEASFKRQPSIQLDDLPSEAISQIEAAFDRLLAAP